ncbi:LysR family transcriptional regulator [Carnimonas nigrificans]|uniref:LysR family transcriptional regulator n=1 Tax=Carnimonas nigrificans TaxID=64323 RepID=UPI0004701734|nr:LysR family transcriptional regulator [Carnimonas nigrificans]
MDIRQLRYFLAVAETLHFTRAAEHLGIAQPPLSQQIRKLEGEIGAPLFHRFSRGVELTEAGKRLQIDAQHVMDAAEQALTNAQRAARGISGRVRLGFASSAVFHASIATTLRAFRARYPQVELAPHESDSPSLIEAVRESRLDAAFVRLPPEDAGLDFTLVAEEALRLVLPEGHAQAAKKAVDPADLRDDPLITAPPWTSPALYELILGVFRHSGGEPLLSQQAPQVPSCPNLVASGFGISLIPESVCQVRSEGVVYPRIKGYSPPISIVLATRHNDQTPTIKNLIEVVKRSAVEGAEATL